MIAPAQEPDGSPGSLSERDREPGADGGDLQGGSPGVVWPIRWPPVNPLPPGGGGQLGCRALTLVEVVIVVAILVTATGLGVPAASRYRENGRVVQAIADIRTMEHEIAIEESSRGSLPDSLADIGRGSFLDPWGRLYEFALYKKGDGKERWDKTEKPLNSDFDLYSKGRDGDSKQKLDKPESLDDIVRALNGAYVGLASEF